MQLLVPQPQGYSMFAVSVQEYRLIDDIAKIIIVFV